MKLTIVSNKSQMIQNIVKSHALFPKKGEDACSLVVYDESTFENEGKVLKMYDEIIKSDICILDINSDTEFSLLFNAVRASIECKGHIIPSDYKSGIRNFLHLGLLTINDITGFNPCLGIEASYSLMKRNIKNIESRGKKVSGKLKDFKNYTLICEYIDKGDTDSCNKLLELLAREYG